MGGGLLVGQLNGTMDERSGLVWGGDAHSYEEVSHGQGKTGTQERRTMTTTSPDRHCTILSAIFLSDVL